MLENRRHFRLKEFVDVTWKVLDQDVSGEGLVVNVSSSGMLLQTDKIFKPSDECILSVESVTDEAPFAPKKGKIVWFERIRTPQERYRCGLEFIPEKVEDGRFKQWLQEKVDRLSEAGDAKILGNMAF